MASFEPSDFGTAKPTETTELTEKLRQFRQLRGTSATATSPAVAIPAANKQAMDWLEMRRAAGWGPLETKHTSR